MYSVLFHYSNKEHNLNFVLFLSESLSGKLVAERKPTDHSHFLHLSDQLDMNPIVDFSDSGDVSSFALDNKSVRQENSSVCKTERAESVSGNHQLVPTEPDQLDLKK